MLKNPTIVAAIISGIFGLIGTILGIWNAIRLQNQGKQYNLELQTEKVKMEGEMHAKLLEMKNKNEADLKILESKLAALDEYLRARRDILESLLDSAIKAKEAANRLVTTGASLRDPNTLIRSFAESLQTITTFFASCNDIKNRRYLQDHEINQLDQVSQALSKLFLSLDVDAEEEQAQEQKTAYEGLEQAVRDLEVLIMPNFQPHKVDVEPKGGDIVPKGNIED